MPTCAHPAGSIITHFICEVSMTTSEVSGGAPADLGEAWLARLSPVSLEILSAVALIAWLCVSHGSTRRFLQQDL